MGRLARIRRISVGDYEFIKISQVPGKLVVG
jgi:hypothetical protein